ncbi:unnamed protein product [Acanthosepion pharaonis]|uniref:EGF-like domain-containing protein n=1 Tax=Acanthosepion pharaonis TaxID=158019 RepID=A0A812DDX5_ACAPH|nr:unnamed protein product [Sepia pharaonis]
MQCCRNSVIFIVASLAFYESFAAKISLVSNNATLSIGQPAKFLCTWQDTEDVGSNRVTWNLPGRIYIFTHSASFHSTWYKFDLPSAIPQANITPISDDVAGYVLSGTNLTLLCTWNPEAQDAYFVRWNWPDSNGEYLGAQNFYSYNFAIPNKTCEGGQLHKWEPNSVSYPLKGRTSMVCLNESSSYLHITNISTADDGISINCWGFTFDAIYTIHVYHDSCASQPCLNSGECINDGISFHCKCLAGFKGRHCSKMKIWLPVTIGGAIVLFLIIIIVISIKVKMLLCPRLQGAVRSDSILSNVHTPYMELGSI